MTLRDVATAAGVSVSTASRALRGQAEAGRIRAETVERIRSAATELGFRPSHMARSLRSQRTGLLGVVAPDVSNPFFSSIARQVTLETEGHGYSVILGDSQDDTQREVTLLRELQSRQVEGLVVCPVGVISDHLLEIHQSGIPLVLVDRTFPELEFLQVTTQHQQGAARAVRMLTDAGHRRIGILQGLPGTLPNEARLAGAREALADAGIDFDNRLVSGSNFTEGSGAESARALMQSHPDVTAFFALSMPNALGALRVAEQTGRSVPDDLSLVAFDDSPFAEFMRVPISTVAQDSQALGMKAAQLILSRLQGKRKSRQAIHQINVEFHPRKSIREIVLP